MLAEDRVLQRLSAGLELLLVFHDPDLATRLLRTAARFERTIPADRAIEVGAAEPALGGADRHGLTAGAGDGGGVHVELEVVLAQHALLDLAPPAPEQARPRHLRSAQP